MSKLPRLVTVDAGLKRFWFFARHGAHLIAATECTDKEVAVRLARNYNRKRFGADPIDLITDRRDPSSVDNRIIVELAPTR